MRRQVFWAIVAAGAVSLLLAGTVALATGTPFVLGSAANSPAALTSVTAQNKDSHGGLNGKMIQLTNQSTGSSATALGLNVGAGRPPFATNSSTKVANLNADRLDGNDATAFTAGGGRTITARVRVSPSLSPTTVFNHPSNPKFRIDYDCPDPNSGGAVRFVNTSDTAVADLFAVEGESTSTVPTVGKGGSVAMNTVALGSGVQFLAGWYDWHRVTAWVFSYHYPDDACYVDLTTYVQ